VAFLPESGSWAAPLPDLSKPAINHQIRIGGHRFRDRIQRGFASPASTGAGEIFSGDTILLVAMSTNSNQGHDEPRFINYTHIRCVK